jgi:hypothetical protein
MPLEKGILGKAEHFKEKSREIYMKTRGQG